MADFDVLEVSPKERYSRFRKVVGEGAYKVVSHGYDLELGVYVAWNSIAISKLTDEQKKKIRDEIQILANLKQRHPNILNIRASWFNKETNTVVFITDLFYSNLSTFISNVKRVKIKVIKKWSLQILEGIRFLHSHRIIHRDLKCANLFINGTSGGIVIGDFGISRETSTLGNASTVLGTPEFMAPEVYDEEYTESADIYSFGMCLLEMVTGAPPYRECENPARIWKRVSDNVKPESLETVDLAVLRDLITWCISFSPGERPTVDEIREHPFFTETSHDDSCVAIGTESSIPEPIPVKSVEDEIAAALNEIHLEETVVEEESSYDTRSLEHSPSEPRLDTDDDDDEEELAADTG